MAQTHDFTFRGTTRFWHFTWLRWNTPFLHRAVTNEIDEPYRNAFATVVHIWPTKIGLVFGRWEDTGRDENEALRAALGAQTLWNGPQCLVPGTENPRIVAPRKIEPILTRTITDKRGKQRSEVTAAPQFAEIADDLLDWLPRTRSGLVKVGKYRYRVDMSLSADNPFRRAKKVERIDRRSPGQFLFGGAR